MCGIAGQVMHGGSVDPILIERMCSAIEHRGPDSRGVYVDGEVGLGIQRLRIIDLETGDQPIFNEDRSVAVVLNGEIYNYRELRERLVHSGHTFRTLSDTEVIVHLYEEQGPECVSSLHGMFAFALWDGRRRQLLLARDRVGKKPLFYSHRGGALTFASELQGLLQNREIPRDLDHQALDCYYAYQYVPAPLSAFRAISKLPPATRMIYRDGVTHQERYWQLRYSPKRLVTDPRELHEEIRATFEAAVRRRMVSDVPLGAFLSGGVDSSAVVAAMARNSSVPVKTFSIGFGQDSFNELPYARQVAEQFATDHHEFMVEPSAIEILPKIVRHYGEPFADSSAIPSFYLAELTRRHVTVALNGDGGDESFGGYHRYVRGRWFEELPAGLRRMIAAGARLVPAAAESRSNRNRIRRVGRLLSLSPAQRYADRMSYFDSAAREDLYTLEYKDAIGDSLAAGIIQSPWDAASGLPSIDVMLKTDVETYLPGDLLVKMDIATMAYSLEARSPLLDHQVMELAATLPAELKLRGAEKKIVFRDALTPWLPRPLLDRTKMGFGVPIGDWFKGELRGYVEDVLLDPGTMARGYFRPEHVRQMLCRHFENTADESPRIWALMVSELWHREYVDSAPVAAENRRADRMAATAHNEGE
jgi:asparagine synthase (glutamine-hydrolysing)